MSENVPLTPQEVADLLKISKNTVYELIKRGELGGYRVRVDSNDVEAYKNKSRAPAAPKLPGFEPPAIDSDYMLYNDDSPSGFVICGQDIMLDLLSRRLEQQFRGLCTLRSYLGSYNGLYALYRGSVQVATSHLWDAATDSYNLPFVRSMLPGTHALVYRLAGHTEGFYVAKGNPKGIKGWDDLKRSDLILVNRESGSGVRVLLDEHLRLLGVSGKDLIGYERECTSHLTVASTVARGGADLGLGSEKAALQSSNIDFIPLQNEQFDLIFKKEDSKLPVFKAIVEIIRSKDFADELKSLGGYNLSELGKLVGEI